MILIKVSKNTYSLKSIKNTIYWLSVNYELLLDLEDSSYLIKCYNPDKTFENKFYQKLNDFSMRDIIDEETTEIKKLIVAKAFYPDLIKFKKIGEFDDPVDIEKKSK